MDRKKIMYIGIITYFSYAFFTNTKEQRGKLNVVVGTLDYRIESDDLNDNTITLSAGERKTLNIKITSLNTINSKYELYYTTTNDDIVIGYSSETVDNPTGTINANQSKMITVTIKNKTSSSATVTFGVQGGFSGKTLTLSQGSSLDTQLNMCDVAPNTVVKAVTYTGAVDPFTAPCDGNYEIELWGAAGAKTAYGAYTKGNITLEENQNLYLYVGKTANTSGNKTIFNSGTGSSNGYNGGGATDVRYFATTPTTEQLNWKNAVGLNSRIMVAGGGGSTSSGTPGAGGGLSGYNGTGTKGGTQTSFGAVQSSNYTASTFGVANGGCTGGNGYYPGGGAACASGAGGGSSYISGHTGCVAIAEGSTTATRAIKKSGCTQGTTDNECSTHYSGKVFTDTVMIDGKGYAWTNAKGALQVMPNPSGGNYASGKGHTGDGYARITYLGD